MADKTSPRILRAYSLPLELFDHLKATQRQRQSDIDRSTGTVSREGDPEWITNSEALSGIVYAHRLMTSAAERAGMTADQLLTAMTLHGLTVTAKGAAEVAL